MELTPGFMHACGSVPTENPMQMHPPEKPKSSVRETFVASRFRARFKPNSFFTCHNNVTVIDRGAFGDLCERIFNGSGFLRSGWQVQDDRK